MNFTFLAVNETINAVNNGSNGSNYTVLDQNKTSLEWIEVKFPILHQHDEEMEKFVRQSMAVASEVRTQTLDIVVSYAKSYEASLNKNNQANQLQEVKLMN
ncbi:unnamed protein product [Brachionus calyciflorus]|uniref:Uncharacterized protein n=1 Tax=Brachionus calyciflorus TaxID=104777 RepID=A0A814G444_9BILA|nr:unnamed protein product [Brachionus calyciflorus]